MPHTLKNNNLELRLDLPHDNYNASRFDWTGKITEVRFRDIPVTGRERDEAGNEHHFGQGLYNEFGIEAALGFDKARVGGWFHKIGVGLLKKTGDAYSFHENYEVRPAEFATEMEAVRIIISCRSEAVNGYAYFLKKTIALQESGFTIRYHLENTGEKAITSSEYVHNFLAVGSDPIGKDYLLRFPFRLRPERFTETVNPEGNAVIGENEIRFNGTPDQQFFFSDLAGGEETAAEWELVHLRHRIGIRETGSFRTGKVNLWGWGHVVSPEVFFHFSVGPGESVEWSRTYRIFFI